MNQSNWNENLGLNMPPEKVAFLNAMLEEMGGKDKNEMMPFLLSVMSRANSKGIQFTDQETDFIISKMKANMSPAERKKVDMLRQMTRMFGRSGNGTKK